MNSGWGKIILGNYGHGVPEEASQVGDGVVLGSCGSVGMGVSEGFPVGVFVGPP